MTVFQKIPVDFLEDIEYNKNNKERLIIRISFKFRCSTTNKCGAVNSGVPLPINAGL